MTYRVAKSAQDQIDGILFISATDFGVEAAGRYYLLMLTAMQAIADNPALPGSRQIARLPGIRAYAMRLSRRKVAADFRVGKPRHLIIYRVERMLPLKSSGSRMIAWCYRGRH